MNRQTIFRIAFFAASLLTISCKGSSPKSTIPPLEIEYAIATSTPLQDKIWFTTSTEPIQSITIEPRVSGYLSSINYNSGDIVRRGDVIFRIDPSLLTTELYSAQAALESAEAQLIEAHNNYRRAEPLVAINAISQSSYDSYKANYSAAQASVKSAEQSLRNAELNCSYATITAPIDGVIADSPASVGDYVGVGTKFSTLTTITDIDTLRITLPIPTSRYLRYRAGGNSSLNGDLLSEIIVILADSTIYPHQAQYAYTQQSASSNNSSIVIVAEIPNPDYTLKSGVFARVRANIGDDIERITIPQQAVSQLQGVNSVWVIAPDSTINYRRVTLGGTYGDMWQVVTGVESGEMVATSGQLKMHQGMKVTPTLK